MTLVKINGIEKKEIGINITRKIKGGIEQKII